MNVSYTSREQIEVYRFNWPVTILVPVLAVFLQAFIPVRLRMFDIFDLPLLVTIFFAVARRNPMSGLLMGSAIGLLQDSLTHNPLGVYGIAKTFIGFFASSLGVKIDVENPGSRLIMVFAFFVLHEFIYFTIQRGMLGQVVAWHWGHEVASGVANAILSVLLFSFLDRFKQRT